MSTAAEPGRQGPDGAIEKRVGLLLLAVGLALALVSLGFLWQSRQSALAQAELSTRNLARSIANHLGEQIRETDLVVGLVIQSLGNSALPQPRSISAFRETILRYVQTHPALHDLYFYDGSGALVISTPATRQLEASAQQRDFFALHRGSELPTLHIGTPYRTGPEGRWVIPLSRRVTAPDGSFGGVVVVLLEMRQLQTYFEQFDLGSDGMIALAHRGGTVLARIPYLESAVGRNLGSTPVHRQYFSRAEAGSFMAPSPVDGIERQYSFQHLELYPVTVVVGTAKSHMLAQWRAAALVNVAGVAALLLLLGYAGLRTHRALDAQRAANRRLSDLERAIDEHAVVAITDVAGNIVHANDKFCALSKYGRDELLGRNHRLLGSDRHPRAFFEGMWSTIAAGGVWKGEIRNRAKDGSTYWEDATIVPFLDAGGRPYQYIAIRSDITARKRADKEIRVAYEQLAQLNQQLAKLAAFDELTGLVNRRRFDETLADELKRARRSGLPLSVLMLDVDFFKQFNDSYGHAAGDECLRRVALTLQRSMRRPGDVVGRWGGEEFAAVLPQTDAAGALVVAQLLREAVQSLAIEHGASPLRHVTISIGVSSCVPARSEVDASEMMDRADRALYQAKREGRNRAVLYGSKAGASAGGIAPGLPPALPQVEPAARKGAGELRPVEGRPEARALPPAPVPEDEQARLEALHRLQILDTPAEARFDRLVDFAARELEMPVAVLSLLDRDRQWFKARFGIDATEMPRATAFCAHAIMGDETFVVEDASQDERFAANPLVTGGPRIRFYAGAPLKSASGHRVGTLCVVDSQPRRLDPLELATLNALRDLIAAQLALGRQTDDGDAGPTKQGSEAEHAA